MELISLPGSKWLPVLPDRLTHSAVSSVQVGQCVTGRAHTLPRPEIEQIVLRVREVRTYSVSDERSRVCKC